MYSQKAAFFDDQSDAAWARAEYSPEEISKLDRVFSHIGPLTGLTVMEPGCGTGRLTALLSDRVGPQGLVVALDISPMMIANARERNRDRSNVQLWQDSVESWKKTPEVFDLVFCHQVFPHFEDKEKVLGKLGEALKKDGRLIVFHFIRSAEINDCHRRAGTVVEHDLLPDESVMRRLFERSGFIIELIIDDDRGYFLSACRKKEWSRSHE